MSASYTLLLVEDDVELLDIFARRFARRGFDVVTCDAFELVLERVRQRNIDVVVMDRTLRGRDCIQLIEPLRAVQPDLQVIVLSGLSDPDSVAYARAAGANDYLVKPCAFAELEASVWRACGHDTREQRE
jgi:DNA-binding response OmpR family regulator